MTGDALVRASRSGHVLTLEINRAQRHNSLNPEVLEALNTALRGAASDDAVRAVILTGAGGVFCAGADITRLDDMREMPLLGAREAVGGSIWTELGLFPKPVIAAVEGLAFGGGFELALACDVIIAGESAKFAVPEVKLGVIPGGGGTQRLVRAVGKSTAMSLLLTGDVLPAGRAREIGVVAQTVADGSALEAATAMAQRIAANSPLAVALAKDAALRAAETPLADGFEHEKRNFHVALRSADSREGQAAFLAKRTPEFIGE